ncbi:MAG TPA: hypothetical protein VN808_02310, partial [Stellaceae bacterium]|nr:hypothetical protein [Stellaceae bacterium]
ADRKKLAEATEESARIGLTVENLAFAISAAREEVAAATRAVTLEARRGQVAEVQEKIPTLRLAARTCSEALAAFVSSYSELYAASADMRRCGFRWPRDEVFAVNLRNSLQFALWSAPGHLNTQALPPPSQRLDVGDVMERFINELELSLQRELDEPVPRRAQDDYGRPPPLPRIPGEEFLVDEPAAAE